MSGTVWPQVVLSTAAGVPYDAGTPLPVNASTTAQANAAAQTWVEGTSNPLSQNLSGDLRVIAKQSGTWNIGTVTTLPALPANQSVNNAQINGVTPLMGNGVTGTGSQRVTIASDNTAFSVNAACTGTVTANAGTGTFAVSGTFWQATQPVSGTFWQATQPVSGTVTTSPPANASSNIAQINGVAPLMGNGVTGTGSQRVTIASDNTAFSVNAVQSGTWNIGTVTTLPALPANQSVNMAQINAVAPLMGNGVTGTGSLRVTIASDNTAYSVNAIQSGTWNIGTVTAVTAITNALPTGTNIIGHVIDDASATAGGIASTSRVASAAASTNATNVKTTAGRIYSAAGKNNANYDVFLVLYDSATNPPVPGTTTIRKKLVCPANQAFVYDWPIGLSCSAGIGFAFTKLVADADTTALVAADISAFNLDYN